MSNSPLVNCTIISPNRNSPRVYALNRITIHCVVGQCSVEALGQLFANPGRQASSNYGIGYDGRVGLYCPECDRSWCSSSWDNDHRAITIEVASDNFHPYAVTPAAYNKLIELCVDICRRNGKKKLLWLGTDALYYAPKADEMVMTAHRWFADTICPGDYLYSRFPAIAAEVTRRLGGQPAPTPTPTGRDYWLPTVTGYNADDFNNGFAGMKDQPITCIAIDDPDVKYRVKILSSQTWLPWVYGKNYNPQDEVNGMAGNRGEPIDEIEVATLSGKQIITDSFDMAQWRWLPPVGNTNVVNDTSGNPGHYMGAFALLSNTVRKYCACVLYK